MEKELQKKIYEFSKIIKDLRLQSGQTQKEVANSLGVSYQSYQAYELGITVPTLQNFIKLSMLYNVSLDYLIGNRLY